VRIRFENIRYITWSLIHFELFYYITGLGVKEGTLT